MKGFTTPTLPAAARGRGRGADLDDISNGGRPLGVGAADGLVLHSDGRSCRLPANEVHQHVVARHVPLGCLLHPAGHGG